MSKRKKAQEKEPNLERWLVSYADFITLLFAVFVVLYAMSQVDKQKAEQAVRSLRSAFGMTAGGDVGVISDMAESSIPIMSLPDGSAAGGEGERYAGANELARMKVELETFLANVGAKDKVRITRDRRWLLISLSASNFFSSGGAEINPAVHPLLDRVAQALLPYDNEIRIEGHTDNQRKPSAHYSSNWDLSSGRALSLLHYLIERQGIAPTRLSATGFGEQHPIADNATEEGRMLNRRVDLLVLLNGRWDRRD